MYPAGSHDTNVPRSLGLRTVALGIAQATDALAIVVSEETGNISIAIAEPSQHASTQPNWNTA